MATVKKEKQELTFKQKRLAYLEGVPANLQKYYISNNKVNRLYSLWLGIKSRTSGYKSKQRGFRNYKNKPFDFNDSFYEFATECINLGYVQKEQEWIAAGRPMRTLTIDRIDNSLGYVRGNMQFISQSENSKKDPPPARIRVDAFGYKNKTIRELSELTGLSKASIQYRIKVGNI